MTQQNFKGNSLNLKASLIKYETDFGIQYPVRIEPLLNSLQHK